MDILLCRVASDRQDGTGNDPHKTSNQCYGLERHEARPDLDATKVVYYDFRLKKRHYADNIAAATALARHAWRDDGTANRLKSLPTREKHCLIGAEAAHKK